MKISHDPSKVSEVFTVGYVIFVGLFGMWMGVIENIVAASLCMCILMHVDTDQQYWEIINFYKETTDNLLNYIDRRK